MYQSPLKAYAKKEVRALQIQNESSRMVGVVEN